MLLILFYFFTSFDLLVSYIPPLTHSLVSLKNNAFTFVMSTFLFFFFFNRFILVHHLVRLNMWMHWFIGWWHNSWWISLHIRNDRKWGGGRCKLISNFMKKILSFKNNEREIKTFLTLTHMEGINIILLCANNFFLLNINLPACIPFINIFLEEFFTCSGKKTHHTFNSSIHERLSLAYRHFILSRTCLIYQYCVIWSNLSAFFVVIKIVIF